MKTTNRIHENRSATRPSPQVKTSSNLQSSSVNGRSASSKNSGAKDGMGFVPAGGATISFYDQNEDGILANRTISIRQLAGLKRRAANSGFSFGSLVQQHLDRALAELEGRHDVRRKADEMHQAVAQEHVLLELITNHLHYREHRLGETFSGERASTFNWGLEMLIQNTRERLEKADKEMMKAAYQNNEVAS